MGNSDTSPLLVALSLKLSSITAERDEIQLSQVELIFSMEETSKDTLDSPAFGPTKGAGMKSK